MIGHILRFSLDRIFASVDTATPDSGDVKRQADRVETERKVQAHTGSCPVSSEKASAKYLLRAERGGATAVRLSANCRPAAVHWRFARVSLRLPGSRLFLLGGFTNPESRGVGFSSRL